MSDILKKAVTEIKTIKKGISEVAKKEVIEESKKHLDNKIAKLLEGEDKVETPSEDNAVVDAELKQDNEKALHDVDFINTVLDNVDIEALVTKDTPELDDDSKEVEDDENPELNTEKNIDEEMSEFEKTDDKTPLSKEEIKAEVEALKQDNTPITEEMEDESVLDELSEEELDELLKEIESEEATEQVEEKVESVYEGEEENVSLSDEELAEAIETLDAEVDANGDDVKSEVEVEVPAVNLKKVAAFAKYLAQYEAEDLMDSNGNINVHSLVDKVCDKFNVAEADEDAVIETIEDVVEKLSKEGADDEDLDEGTSRSWKNANSKNVKPSQYAEYNKDKEPIHEMVANLKGLTEKLIAENTELKKLNVESQENLKKIKSKLYEATVMSHKTAYVNQLFLENNLSTDEKTKVVESFINVNTIEDSKKTHEMLKEEFSRKPLVKESVTEKITRTTIIANDVNSKVLAEGVKQTNPLFNKWVQLANGK